MPIDDNFMRCLFKDDLDLAQEVLRTITGMDDLTLVKAETQRDLRRLAGARSVELDVWGADSKGGWHDIEVQRGYEPDPRRARYHSAAMDVETLDAGMPFSSLPEQWVVFIMEHDPFGKGEGTYLFERTCGESDGLDGGTHILYANASYRAENKLGRLMGDFCESDPSKMQTDALRKRVEYYKGEPEGVGEMCEILEEMCDEARQVGAEQTMLESVRSIVKNLHLTAEEALRALDVPKSDWPCYLSML